MRFYYIGLFGLKLNLHFSVVFLIGIFGSMGFSERVILSSGRLCFTPSQARRQEVVLQAYRRTHLALSEDATRGVFEGIKKQRWEFSHGERWGVMTLFDATEKRPRINIMVGLYPKIIFASNRNWINSYNFISGIKESYIA